MKVVLNAIFNDEPYYGTNDELCNLWMEKVRMDFGFTKKTSFSLSKFFYMRTGFFEESSSMVIDVDKLPLSEKEKYYLRNHLTDYQNSQKREAIYKTDE